MHRFRRRKGQGVSGGALTAVAERPTNVAGAAAAGADKEPIAGVSLELFTEIARDLPDYGYDQARAAAVAASRGVSAEAWEQAMAGWNSRMADPDVARRFNALYTER